MARSIFVALLSLGALLGAYAMEELCGSTAEYAFLIDTSGSVSSGQFLEEVDFAKTFVTNVDASTSYFDGYFFDSFTMRLIGLTGMTNDRSEVLAALPEFKPSSGGTDTGFAIIGATSLFTGTAGRAKVIILITDGEPNDQQAAEDAAALAKADNITIVTVGVGIAEGSNAEEDMKRIASNDLYFPTTFDLLASSIIEIGSAACPAQVDCEDKEVESCDPVSFSDATDIVTMFSPQSATVTYAGGEDASDFTFPVGTTSVTATVDNVGSSDTCTQTVTVTCTPPPVEEDDGDDDVDVKDRGNPTYPVNPDDENTGVQGDPHFTGFDGSKFDYHGRVGQAFCVLSTPTYQVNALISQELSEGLTYVGAVGLVTPGGERIKLSAMDSQVAVAIDDVPVNVSPGYVSQSGVVLEVDGADVVVALPHLRMTVAVHRGEFLDLKYVKLVDQDLADVQGVLGHTAAPSRSIEGFQGEESDYYTADIYAQGFRCNMSDAASHRKMGGKWKVVESADVEIGEAAMETA